jgi:phenylacetaldehyde dehydrogenase
MDTFTDTGALDSRLGAPAKAFVGRRNRLLIDGKLVDAASGKTFPDYNPATGTILTQVAEADAEDVDRAVKAARRAFDEGPWSKMSPSDRGKLLWKLAALIEQNSEEFAEIESIDNGKPVGVARMADVPLAVDMFRYMGGWATKITGSTIPLSFPGEFLSYTLREPVGVVGQIIPWNFPLLMAAWKLAPALAVGCTVVLKAAEQTPLSALRLAELILEAGFPAGVVNILAGYGETAGAALASHDLVDKVAFTGSNSAVSRRRSYFPTPTSTAPFPARQWASSSTKAKPAAQARVCSRTKRCSTRWSRASVMWPSRSSWGRGSIPRLRWVRWCRKSSSRA